ncbi:MAG: MaoC family dehydratase [Acidobacteria bacterium]|jgi:3-hydroxybutyryl-CoA dehydratase|nr:MaoC family dehydratase [Acidobacteriota bacterium]
MKLHIGATAAYSKKITDNDIQAFAELTGDHNPLHLDDDYARTTRFGRRIAHGMLSASLISTVLGTELASEGVISLGYTVRFIAPVFPDDTVTARATIIKIREDKPIVTLETMCENQHGEVLIQGEAVMLLN